MTVAIFSLAKFFNLAFLIDGFLFIKSFNGKVNSKTGDESNLAMYAGFMVTSMVAMAAVLFLAKPKKGKYAR